MDNTASQSKRTGGAKYEVRCEDCKATIRHTDDVRESYAGGTCDACRAKTAKAVARIVKARAAMMKLHGCIGCGGRDEHRSFTCPVLAADICDARRVHP